MPVHESSSRHAFYRLVLILLKIGIVAAAKGQTFTFSPGDGDAFTQRVHREMTVELQGQRRAKGFEIHDTVIEWKVTRTPEGFRLARTTVDDAHSINGKPITDDPARPLLIGRSHVRVLDSQGKFLRLEGHETLLQDAKRVLPAQAFSSLRQFSPEFLESLERTNYDLECGWMLGRKVTLGARWELEPEIPLPNAAKMKAIARVVDVSPSGRLAAVLVFASSDPALLTAVDTNAIRTIEDRAVTDFFEWDIAKLPLLKTCTLTTLEPQTMRFRKREAIEEKVEKTPAGITRTYQRDTETFEYKR